RRRPRLRAPGLRRRPGGRAPQPPAHADARRPRRARPRLRPDPDLPGRDAARPAHPRHQPRPVAVGAHRRRAARHRRRDRVRAPARALDNQLEGASRAGAGTAGAVLGWRTPKRNLVTRVRRTSRSYTAKISTNEPTTIAAYFTMLGASHWMTTSPTATRIGWCSTDTGRAGSARGPTTPRQNP